MRLISSLANCSASSCDWAWPVSVSGGSSMPGLLGFAKNDVEHRLSVTGEIHFYAAVLPMKRQRSLTAQFQHSGLRALQI